MESRRVFFVVQLNRWWNWITSHHFLQSCFHCFQFSSWSFLLCKNIFILALLSGRVIALFGSWTPSGEAEAQNLQWKLRFVEYAWESPSHLRVILSQILFRVYRTCWRCIIGRCILHLPEECISKGTLSGLHVRKSTTFFRGCHNVGLFECLAKKP